MTRGEDSDARTFEEAGKPPPVPEPCNDCPWRRNAVPGWLGPHDADEWIEMAHTDVPIACHETIREDDSWEGAHQCRGAAIFRANVAKSPRDPAIETGPENHERVFSTNAEFKAYHERRELTEDERAAAERRRNA